ncbi:DNA alkylation repair protein [Planctobacterium marinum]|uniref:DNA alkylation repair protein n=1 Tax=Planctobacterium marinum TaxID=1631968 RepID=UPI001E36EE5B|nr:DNA alkylation repair protein [Planctobacterium marinum]MCC2605872.1 DNA alkylation repair protein [Planctobacterium marinum]
MMLAQRLEQQLREHQEPSRALKMQSYMKTQQAFFGVPAPLRKKLFKMAEKQAPLTSRTEYESTIMQLWQGSHRELQYQALEVAEFYKVFRTPESLPLYEQLLLSAENWDTVDWIAITLVGLLIKAHPTLESTLLRWQQHDNLWLRRASLIAHIKHKKDTNLTLLSDTILQLAQEKPFFIRKAIGWVLREYGKTDAEWVLRFVQNNQHLLSGLSQREALKHINKNRSYTL